MAARKGRPRTYIGRIKYFKSRYYSRYTEDSICSFSSSRTTAVPNIDE
ncbi:hypothetical protein EYZ11_000555 [Aspergillus tanneri]|uniref:Uncharacterized protein n=1 Tax=Aspergillus tanneri TaxID=1220188 RepID=A0A4S3JWU6_9EURO|nr:hypothetical protein EYZ11_000555 [Aspergillus tanneri]